MRRDAYKKGELVLVRNSEQEMWLNRKTKPRYLGPYEVCRRTKGGSYVLKELDGSVLQQSVAAFRLMLYVSRHDRKLLKEISREVGKEEEESDEDDDWYSGSESDPYEDDEDD
jgi:hypothetical protein